MGSISISEKARSYAIEKHRATNHYYDQYPYEFHLQMVVNAAQKFIHLIPTAAQQNVIAGCWVHDVIEDARETYNDVKKALNEDVAELAYALTNDKGRNRQERAGEKYYAGIRNTPYATFIKLCDRIANVTHSKNTGSRMLEVYRKENPAFVAKLYDVQYVEVIQYLEELLKWLKNLKFSLQKKKFKPLHSLKLKTQPKIGQFEELLKDRKQNFRYLLFKNYKIIYWLNTDKNWIEIVEVFDTSQNPTKISRSSQESE